MFNSCRDFLMATFNHWSSLRISQITTSSFYYITSSWIGVSAIWTFETFFSRLKITFKTTLVTSINWCICSQITNPVISIIPNSFKRFRILLQNWIFTIMNKSTGCTSLDVIFFKIKFFERSWIFSNIIVERVCIILFICNILNYTKLLFVQTAKTVS